MPEPHDKTEPRLLLTAAEAYPALEQLFLETEQEISAGFRVFDVETRLRSEAAREVGDTWADLVAHVLKRGVSFRLILPDFDPIARPRLHHMTHESIERLQAAGAASGHPERLNVIASMHPARLGSLPRYLLWPKSLSKINAEASRLNDMPQDEAEEELRNMPGLRPLLAGAHPDYRARRWPAPPLVPVTHHQKLAVFDRERLYIGGLDLNERRYDTPEHDQPGSQTWHDAQILVHGEVAREAHHHLATMEKVCANERPVEPTRHLLRTLSSRRNRNVLSMSPKSVDRSLERAHVTHAARSERLIYLESQFFRSVPLARALAHAARAKPDLRLLLVVPGAPEDVAYEGATESDARYGEYMQAKSVQIVQKAFGKRCFVMSPAQPKYVGEHGRATLWRAPLVYLHAKVSIFDDLAAIISSANLNGRSLRWDTEAGVTLDEADQVREARRRCFEHWLPGNAGPEAYEMETAVDAWRRIAEENAARTPEERDGFLMPYPVSPAKRFGRNLPGVPEEMV